MTQTQPVVAIRDATAADVDAITALLAEAFLTGPVSEWLVSEPAQIVAHYDDMLPLSAQIGRDVPAELRRIFVGQQAAIALGYGANAAPRLPGCCTSLLYCVVQQPGVVLTHPRPILPLVTRVQPAAPTQAQTRLRVHGQEDVSALDLPLRVPPESIGAVNCSHLLHHPALMVVPQQLRHRVDRIDLTGRDPRPGDRDPRRRRFNRLPARRPHPLDRELRRRARAEVVVAPAHGDHAEPVGVRCVGVPQRPCQPPQQSVLTPSGRIFGRIIDIEEHARTIAANIDTWPCPVAMSP
jgi:hypothetical protein